MYSTGVPGYWPPPAPLAHNQDRNQPLPSLTTIFNSRHVQVPYTERITPYGRPTEALQAPPPCHPIPPGPSSTWALSHFLYSLKQWRECANLAPLYIANTSVHTELLQQLCTTALPSEATPPPHLHRIWQTRSYKKQVRKLKRHLSREQGPFPEVALPPPYAEVDYQEPGQQI